MREIYISDATLRLESKQSDTGLSFREKLEIAKAIDRLHLHGIDLPPLKNGKADVLLVKSISRCVQNSRLVLPVGMNKESIDEAQSALGEAKRPALMVSLPTSAVQMEYLCHQKPDGMIQQIGELVSYAKSRCGDVEFCAEDATRSEPDFLCRALEAAVKAGADTIVLSDTAGLLLPDEFGDFIHRLFGRVPALPSRLMGVQCWDGMHVAAACAVSGVMNGAGLMKATLRPCGLATLTDLSDIFRTRGGDLGLCASYGVTELNRVAGQVDWLMHAKRSSGSPFDNGVAEAPAPGPKLNVNSTPREIIAEVEKLGYDLSQEDGAKVCEAFALIAAKKDVDARELDAIVASAALQVPPTYVLESYVINCGNIITATAHLKLLRQGKALQGIAIGDGPVDAAFLAIEQIVGHHYELDDFQIQAVTEGREAMGSTLVRLRSNGKLYSGKGISTDTVGASILAYLNALNKILYEEAVRP